MREQDIIDNDERIILKATYSEETLVNFSIDIDEALEGAPPEVLGGAFEIIVRYVGE